MFVLVFFAFCLLLEFVGNKLRFYRLFEEVESRVGFGFLDGFNLLLDLLWISWIELRVGVS